MGLRVYIYILGDRNIATNNSTVWNIITINCNNKVILCIRTIYKRVCVIRIANGG